jgi:hypothetical protein
MFDPYQIAAPALLGTALLFVGRIWLRDLFGPSCAAQSELGDIAFDLLYPLTRGLPWASSTSDVGYPDQRIQPIGRTARRQAVRAKIAYLVFQFGEMSHRATLPCS